MTDANSKASSAANYLAGKMNNPGRFLDCQIGERQGIAFAAASPTGDGAVTVIVIAAAYAVRSVDDPLDQEFFPCV